MLDAIKKHKIKYDKNVQQQELTTNTNKDKEQRPQAKILTDTACFTV